MPDIEFKGKWHVYAHHLSVPFRPLVPDPDRSAGEPSPDGNLVIHGDNLYGLKALLPRYAGRVKCIYIDPPYNTGNEGWIYNDNLNSPLMREWVKQDAPVDGEDLERHDKWCCMMWPRLQLLRELLSDDGVIFISIDDNEQHHLRMLMNEIFGEENFVEIFAWKKKGGASNTETVIGDIIEYIVMYAKDSASLQVNRRIVESARYPFRDEQGSYRLEAITKTDEGMYRWDSMKFAVPVPGTEEVAIPPQGKRWTIGKDRMMNLLESSLLEFNRTESGWDVKMKRYFDESDPQTGVYLNLLLEHGSLNTAKNELAALKFPREQFSTPKPTALIRQLLRIATNSDDIVLDSFAGSGTTAQAVLELNKDDGGDRKFILVECEDYADAITAERVRRVIAGVPDAKDVVLREGLGGSFLYCALGKPIEVEGMLTDDEALPPFASLAAWLLHTATGVSAETAQLRAMDEDGHFYSDDRHDYHLLYKPSVEWLRSDDAVLNEERAYRIGDAVRARGREAVVFGAARYISQRDLTDEHDITFCQLPYEIHRLRNGDR